MPEDPRELGLPDFRNPAVAAIAYGETLLKLQASEAVVQQLQVEKAANEAELSVTKPKAEAYQRLIEQDYFEVRLVHRGDEVFSQTLVTAKGMAMLARRLNLLQNGLQG